MTEQEYFEELAKLGLRPSGQWTERGMIFWDGDGNPFMVPSPLRLSPDDLQETFDFIKEMVKPRNGIH